MPSHTPLLQLLLFTKRKEEKNPHEQDNEPSIMRACPTCKGTIPITMVCVFWRRKQIARDEGSRKREEKMTP
jgi:hypothetical protein